MVERRDLAGTPTSFYSLAHGGLAADPSRSSIVSATVVRPSQLWRDETLAAFEAALAALDAPSDDEVFTEIERVVLALNTVNEEYDEVAYETDEREELCAYIEQALTEAGIDVDALATRRGLARHEITDEWRDW